MDTYPSDGIPSRLRHEPTEPTLYDKLVTVTRQLDEARMELASAADASMAAATYYDKCSARVVDIIGEFNELSEQVRNL